MNIGGVPVDLNAGMIEAVTNPPQGFASKHTFVESEIASRIRAIDWFAHCGEPLSLDLSMETEQVTGWRKPFSHAKTQYGKTSNLKHRIN